MNKQLKKLINRAKKWNGNHVDDYMQIIKTLHDEHADYFLPNRWDFYQQHDYANLSSLMRELYDMGWVVGEGFIESDKLGNIIYNDAYGNIEGTHINLVIRDWAVGEGIDVGELDWFNKIWAKIPYVEMIEMFGEPLNVVRNTLMKLKLTYA